MAVIIVNWNTADLLDRCLTALYTSVDDLDLSVCVVDNGSTDGSLELIRTRYPKVKVIANLDNVGFAKANNQGIRATESRYVLLLNSDAFLYPGVIQRLVTRMEEYPDTGAIGCQLLYEDLSLQRSCYSFPDLATELWQALLLDKIFPRSAVFGKYQMTYWEMNDFREVDVVMGAVMLLRRGALDQIGLLDESFFMYSEEVDLCYRLKKNRWLVRYEPESKAIHLWGGSAKKVPAETLVRLYRSRVQFFRKHYGKVTADLYKTLLYFESGLRVIGGYLAYIFLRKSTLFEKAQIYNHMLPNIWSF